MYNIKRVLLCLDLSIMDEALMKYTAMLTKYMGIEKIYLLHVTEDLELDEEIVSKYPNLMAPLDESIESVIKDRADKIFEGINVDIEIEAMEGEPFEKVLRWSKVKEIDLVVMGRKHHLPGSGFLPDKMAQLLLCSILFVPENVIAKLDRILVPFDFSEFSDQALEQAIYLKNQYGAEVVCQHVYEVPHGYHTTGKSFEDFAKIMKENAVKKFEKHITNLENVDLKDIEVEYTLSEKKDLCQLVNHYANQIDADLIVAGSRGRTPMASLLLGSVAGKLIRHDNNLPLLVVKNKESNMNFFEALLNL